MVAEQTAVSRWIELIQAEYTENPGLNLTKPQVQRLWGLDAPTCDVLLDRLEGIKFLKRTPRNGYVRTGRGL